MTLIQILVISLVAFEHFYFMFLEMFYWDKPKGLKAFGLTLEEAKSSKTLAKNQGLYNGFLATGLIWSIFVKENSLHIALFFLICISIAGIFGTYTTKKIKLFYIQTIPAIIGILILLFKI